MNREPAGLATQDKTRTGLNTAPISGCPENLSLSGTEPSGTPDEVLVKQARNGNEQAFAILAGRHLKGTYISAYGVLGSREDAEDAVQEAMIKAYNNLHSLREPSKAGAWLRSIARQEALGRMRGFARLRKMLGNLWQERQSDPPEYTDQTERHLYHRQLFEYCIAGLPSKARDIVLLHYVEGLSCDEIVSRTGAQSGTVKSHLFKARAKMREQLETIGVLSVDDL